MWDSVILFKLTYTLGASLLLFFGGGFLKKFSSQKNSTLLTFIAFRIAPFIVIYLVAGIEPRGDIPFFFYKAQHAQEFELVYRDFWSYHAPLFSYVLGLLMFLWKSPAAIVLLFLLGEYLTLRLTQKYAEDISNFKAIQYLILPAPFIIMLLGGQEDLVLWAVVVFAYYVFLRYKSTFYFGAAMAINLVFMKITAVVYFLPIFIYLKKRWGFALGAAAVSLPVFGLTYWLVGNDMFMFLEHTDIAFSPNLHTIIKPLFGSRLDEGALLYLNFGALFFIALVLVLAAIKLRSLPIKKALAVFWVMTYGLMTALLPASMIYYVYTFLLIAIFFTMDLNSKKELGLFLFFNFAVVLQPYLFVKLGQQLHHDFSFATNPMMMFEYLLEAFLVVYVLKMALDAYQVGVQKIRN